MTALTFVIGGLALAGVPPLVGFFSKDLILVTALEERHYVLWLMGTGAALLTAIYTARAAGRTFFGTPGPAVKEAHHLHEAPGSMAVPLWVLAALSVAGGVLGATWTGEPLQHFLRPVVGAKPAHAPLAEGLAVAVAVLGLLLGWAGYVTGRLRVGAPALAETVARRFYIEAAYDLLVVRPLKFGARVSAAAIDPLVIDGAVNGVGRLVQVAGTGLRHLQTGYVRAYAAVLLAGTVIALGYWLIR
ncbi:MAG: hypothetical protein HY660_06350 [Armatimonadetes bacterium]|nr:hypothetical protein [Armatimonadota bacterium]